MSSRRIFKDFNQTSRCLLFETTDQAQPIDEKRATKFRNITAKTPFLAKRARLDIQLAVSILCMRVHRPEKHDRKKFGRLLQYLRSSSHIALTPEADNSHVVRRWVTSAFAV